jgi:hypothetical protein
MWLIFPKRLHKYTIGGDHLTKNEWMHFASAFTSVMGSNRRQHHASISHTIALRIV